MTKIFAATALISLAALSQAGTISMKNTGDSPSMTGLVSLKGKLTYTSIGVLSFKTSLGSTIKSVCGDLTSDLDSSTHKYTVSTSSSLASNYKHAGQIVSTYLGQATTSAKAAGLQLAVWDALYNNGKKFNTGSAFKFSTFDFGTVSRYNTAAYWANYYYAANSGNSWFLKTTDFGGQSQFTDKNPTPASTPEPATMAGVGLAVAAAVRRRRKA